MKSDVFSILQIDDYRNKEDTVIDRTINGQCSRCGGCCTDILPMNYIEIDRIQRYVKQHHIQPIEHIHDPNTIDLLCPFLDQKSHSCIIYDVRPRICRDFICSLGKEDIAKLRDDGASKSMRGHVLGDMEYYSRLRQFYFACMLLGGDNHNIN